MVLEKLCCCHPGSRCMDLCLINKIMNSWQKITLVSDEPVSKKERLKKLATRVLCKYAIVSGGCSLLCSNTLNTCTINSFHRQLQVYYLITRMPCRSQDLTNVCTGCHVNFRTRMALLSWLVPHFLALWSDILMDYLQLASGLLS